MSQFEDYRYVLCAGGLIAGTLCGLIAIMISNPGHEFTNPLISREVSYVKNETKVELSKSKSSISNSRSLAALRRHKLPPNMTKQLRQFALENNRLKKLVADQATNVQTLKKARCQGS